MTIQLTSGTAMALFSADITDIIYPEGQNGVKNHINELSFDINWNYDVSVVDSEVNGIDINEVFHNFVLYSNYVTLYVYDKYENKGRHNMHSDASFCWIDNSFNNREHF